MKIKRTFLLLISSIFICGFTGCGPVKLTPAEKAEMIKNMEIIKADINEKDFYIDVNYMIPQRGLSAPLNSSYSVSVLGDEIVSDLPYYGEASMVPYGGGHGLNFRSTIDSMKQRHSGDHFTIRIKTHDIEGSYEYEILIYDNGRAEITVTSVYLDTIRYFGDYRFRN